MKNANELVSLLHDPSPENAALVRRAYMFAEEAHRGQKRFSGEPYFIHVSAVAETLARMHMDAATIAAGILHDTIEDGGVPEEKIKKEFGNEIAFLVEGVTKLGKLKYRGLERHAESLRKFFVASSQDIRVVLIKLADRLHNVETLAHVREEKRRRIALETLEIYAPLADRLGMGRLKGALEDYSFPYAFPEEYRQTLELRGQKKTATEKNLLKVRRILQKELSKKGFTDFHSDYRVKHLYSLYKKLKRYDGDIEKIYDIVALRIIVPTVADCYKALGDIHALMRPLPGRIKDYIAFPKPNGYRSLHTTVFADDGGTVEIQIRTEEMHREAELGLAAHFAYKEAKTINPEWIRELAEWQKDVTESHEFLEHLKTDFFKNRIFVLTPLGEVIDLPEESSPIDFAYAVHTEIGDRAFGAKVNGKMISLDTKLKNGDMVEIITNKKSRPTAKWLTFTRTTLAKRNIRSSLLKK
ncbi:RelA/SpoT family protein [bacterium]|nr:RelA/SpoT family protein [bacterium]